VIALNVSIAIVKLESNNGDTQSVVLCEQYAAYRLISSLLHLSATFSFRFVSPDLSPVCRPLPSRQWASTLGITLAISYLCVF
jgi:hypothetical protein